MLPLAHGTLRFLLGKGREKFSTEPTVAYQITAAVLDFVAGWMRRQTLPLSGLHGLAWKEHANAALQRGEIREALAAAERSVEIYGSMRGRSAALFPWASARGRS
jgi:hypothetical protein